MKMTAVKKTVFGLSITLLTTTCLAQQVALNFSSKFKESLIEADPVTKEKTNFTKEIDSRKLNFDLCFTNDFLNQSHSIDSLFLEKNGGLGTHFNVMKQNNQPTSNKQITLLNFSCINEGGLKSGLNFLSHEKEPFFKNRRNVYSSMWAFASLNYLYADLAGLMDKNILLQYQTGVVDGAKITPEFLTVAAGFLQIPIANVFLPHIIKNEKTLRWVQIVSGTIMTLVQSGTLFVGKPTPYYALFSACEIAATTYITIDAIKWKAKSNKKKIILN